MLRQPAAALRRNLRRPIAEGTTTPRARTSDTPRRTFLSRRDAKETGRPVENLNLGRLSQKSQEYERNRRVFLWSGAIAGIVSFCYTAYKLKQEISKPAKFDSDPSAPGADAADRKVVIHDEDGREIVATGNSTVPTFPRTIELPSYTAPGQATSPSSDPLQTPALSLSGATTEYTLVGLGLRTVTFIGIQVYVVGYYVATADIAALQSALVKTVNPIATTLVAGERDGLRGRLLDPVEGEQTWDELLARGIPARSAFRVVPVRDTDFHHLRDGFVRAIQGRAGPAAASDEIFGEAMRQFRAIFNRGSVQKRKELLLVRDEAGKLSIAFDDGAKGGKKKEEAAGSRKLIGIVDDERVSRALWLNYLAGKNVASEPARKNIVEGIMEFVERPVGTVATQVV
ncbi:chalcone-flavanone isomerase-domain-containing protein [Apodospora peruviana]|uniref:Chalcone-flavanone isomerase-domain-containing protein n=1 Tax=Apodospora peruviana TaxID=516989 RepID=A0AAE0IJI7_9PEZI|nr:chalcone-flavanone isomerase-domain-containing protein [Apodospora peruviana]